MGSFKSFVLAAFRLSAAAPPLNDCVEGAREMFMPRAMFNGTLTFLGRFKSGSCRPS